MIDPPDTSWPRPPRREDARALYWQGYAVAEIARRLGMKYATVDSWKRRGRWDEAPRAARIEDAAERRLAILIAKPDKTDRDLSEIDHLGRLIERTARVQKYDDTGRESDLNPKVHNRAEGRAKAKQKKNTLSEDQVDALRADFFKRFWRYQLRWYEAKARHRRRLIIKSRQIGATYYFALEAALDAIETGDNQIFLSASKSQAHVFKSYIVRWVYDVTGAELQGTPIKLWNGAELYFLGTNSRTAQSYHGHVYLDEFAWIGRFAEFKKVAGAMATHKTWRTTYFSTPSTIGHEAAAFWDGREFNRDQPRGEQAEFLTSHEALKDGLVGPDGTWRQMVTVDDAIAQGCDLFDLEDERRKYNERDFANLFLCQWVDDAASFFTFAELQKCGVDTWDAWPDVPPLEDPGTGNRHNLGPVWIGYDPSRSRDDASVAVIAPPAAEGGAYRVVERQTFNGVDFQAQAEAIRRLTERYQVERIAVDVSGIGQGVFEMVQGFWPAAVAITYSVETKARMVLKAKHLISRRRVEWDASQTDIPLAFLAIRQTMTPTGRQMTFQASRSDTTGHADVAWAIMHSLDRVAFRDFDQPEGGHAASRRGFMEIF